MKPGSPCHGVCVADLASIMENLERQATEAELDLETGWGTEEFGGSAKQEPERSPSPPSPPRRQEKPLYRIRGENDDKEKNEPKKEEPVKEKVDPGQLMKMGLKTALAIVLHNFPEGIATFVAALQDPRLGAVLAVAIAVHNIPEGLCVALPVYYANQSKWQAFGYAFMSGMAEPFAALVYWAIAGGSVSNDLFGVMFGVVSGMMVLISFRELIPTALKHDKEMKVVTGALTAGMFVMALSLVLFQL